MLLEKSVAATRMFFLGAPALGPTVTISKNGGAFGAPIGSVSEISDGWYALALNAADTDTEGALAYHFSAGTPADFDDQVVNWIVNGFVACDLRLWRGTLPQILSNQFVQASFREAAANVISAAVLDTSVVAKLFSTTAIAESYAADGANGTVTNLLYMILQALTEFSISGGTMTVKKLDGSTTAMTYTLAPSGNPTSRTRAT